MKSIRQPALPAAAVVLIALAAGGIRAYRIDGRSLWLDEILTSQAAHLGSLREVLSWTRADPNQTPLFYAFTWLLGRWGDDAIILRLPSAVAGTLTVLALFDLARRLFGIRAGIIAALLTAVLPFMVWYSQEARMYSLLMLVTTLQMTFAYRAIKADRAVDWAGLAAFTLLNLYTQYVALLATLALAIYVGAFVAAGLLQGTPAWIKGAAVLALLLVLVVAALLPWRATLAAGYGTIGHVATAFGLRGSYRAAAAALVVVAVGVGAILLASRWRFLRARAAAARRLYLAVATGIVVTIGYVPWLPSLRFFLNNPGRNLGRLQVTHGPSLDDGARLLGAFGLSGVLLAAFVLGLAAVVVWLFRGRAAESGLLVSCLTVQSIAFLALARSAIFTVNPRYMSCIVVGAIVVTAAGADVIARATAQLAKHVATSQLPGRTPDAIAGLLVAVVLMAQAVPALAASYGVPKEDYRAAARHIAGLSGPNSTLIAIGAYSDWAVLCFEYYFRELGASTVVVDGLRLSGDVATRLDAGGEVWGVVIFPSVDQLALLNAQSDVKSEFVDVTGIIHVVRIDTPGLSRLDQARALLTWELPLDAKLSAPLKLLDFLSGRATAGDNLVRDYGNSASGSGWSLPPGADVRDAALALTPAPAGTEAVATYATVLPDSGDYLVAVDCRGPGFKGSQTFDVVPLDGHGRPLPTYPGAAPFQCGSSDVWSRSYFALQSPPGTASIAMFLRATGTGTAEFRSVQLSLMTD